MRYPKRPVRVYAPGNEDYEYDKHVQEKIDMSGQPAVRDWKDEPMSALGKSLFEQAALVNEGQRVMLMEGRKQMAREVRCVIESFIADAKKGNIRPIAAELLALVERELA